MNHRSPKFLIRVTRITWINWSWSIWMDQDGFDPLSVSASQISSFILNGIFLRHLNKEMKLKCLCKCAPWSEKEHLNSTVFIGGGLQMFTAACRPHVENTCTDISSRRDHQASCGSPACPVRAGPQTARLPPEMKLELDLHYLSLPCLNSCISTHIF